MKAIPWILGAFVVISPIVLWADADIALTVDNAPPVVVKTVPEAGAIEVDPSLKKIEVTFSKEMMDKSWSWTGKEQLPGITGTPSYKDDKRTCVLPVKLEPGREYAIGVNSQSFQNFKDVGNRPAMQYLIVFRTRK